MAVTGLPVTYLYTQHAPSMDDHRNSVLHRQLECSPTFDWAVAIQCRFLSSKFTQLFRDGASSPCGCAHHYDVKYTQLVASNMYRIMTAGLICKIYFTDIVL